MSLQKWFKPPPRLPAWYWIVYWAMSVIGVALLFCQGIPHRIPLTGLWVGALQLVLIPLMWKKSPRRMRPWVTLLLATMALAMLWAVVVWWH